MPQNTKVTLRAATAADQTVITKLVREVGINPLQLAWPNFLIAERIEAAPRVVGIGQLRPHGDGIVELASLAVVEDARGSGIGTLLVNALVDKADRPLFLMCESSKVGYYQRFDFVELIDPKTHPRSLRKWYRFATVIQRIAALFGHKLPYLAIMAHRGRPSAQ